MTPLARPIFHAVHGLAVGSLFCLALLPFPLIRRGFFRTCVMILAGAVGLGIWITPTAASAALFVALLLYGGSLWIPAARWPRTLLLLTLAVGAAGLLRPSLGSIRTLALSTDTVAQLGTTLTSSLLLGSALIGMLLGHYYLRDPSLPVWLIRRLANLFLLATVLQGVLLVVNLGGLYLFGGVEAAARIGVLSTSYAAVFLGRLLIGILGSFILACVIWDTLRIPNVQAATGFFYVAILTVTIGEFLGRYLWQTTSLPL
jgi:protein NrfD